MSPFDLKNARIGHVTRVIARLEVCVPKKSVYPRGVVMMSKWVAALMKDGNVRCGGRSKSSPAPSAISFDPCQHLAQPALCRQRNGTTWRISASVATGFSDQ